MRKEFEAEIVLNLFLILGDLRLNVLMKLFLLKEKRVCLCGNSMCNEKDPLLT